MADNGVYGRGLTRPGVADALRKTDDYYGSQSTWNMLENQADVDYATQNAALESDFKDYVYQAYGSAMQQKQIAENIGLVGQGRVAYDKSVENAYQEAYDTYRYKLSEKQSENYQNYIKQMNQINEELYTRAENFATLGNTLYDYAEYMYKTYYGNAESSFWNNPDAKRIFLTPDENAPGQMRLRTKDELYNYNVYVDPETGEEEVRSIYDEQGNLTGFGRDYFDILENFNYKNTGNETTFGSWLYENNKDLYDWAFEEQNLYDVSTGGRNVESWHELTGRDAMDYQYSVAEHFGSMSKGTIKSFFNDVSSKIDNVFSGSMKMGAKSAITSSKDIVSDLENLAVQLGIADDFEKQGFSFEKLSGSLDLLLDGVKDNGEMTGDWFGRWGQWIGGGAGAGMIVGGIAGTVAGGPLMGVATGATVGAIGAIVGAIGGIIHASIDTSNQREQNEQFANQAKQQLKSAINQMVNYSVAKSEYKRRQQS